MTRAGLAASAATMMWLGLALGATACGASKPIAPSAAVPGGSGAGGDSPVVPSTGASPISLSFEAGACRVDVQTALGASYKFKVSEGDAVNAAIRQAVSGCLGAKGSHGTLHIEATVDGSGAVSGVTTSPGGALSTGVAQCVEASMGKAHLVAPQEAQANELLVFGVSECKK